jgi:hypothetical protein
MATQVTRPRLWAALALATAALAAIGRICIDIAAEIDEMASDYRTEVPDLVPEAWLEFEAEQ